ncbi:MAG TPA: hypothetical protein VGE01_14370 [Fimbriimonas sp.]
MSFAARLLIAFIVVLSQTGLGRAATPCPELAPKVPAVCPMSQVPGCNCCGDASKPDAGAKCEIKASKDTSVQATLTVGFAPIAVAILPAAPYIEFGPTVDVFERPHLVVPRVRAPDIVQNPLRGPPCV